jgi:diadenosine tetraphosphate (Ap4A) HIT family hydrolase
MDITSHNFL